jgi:hypothetical protein
MTNISDHSSETDQPTYQETISELASNAEQLELVYHQALKAGETTAFEEAIDANFTDAPENLLFAAWYHRLKFAASQAKSGAVAWAWAAPLALIQSLLFWWLSDDRYLVATKGYGGLSNDYIPALVLLAGPISAVFMLVYLTAVSRKKWQLPLIIGAITIAAGLYVILVSPQVGTQPFQQQYLTLMSIHLPLLAWAGVGTFLVADHRDRVNRFTLLIKSFEVFVMAGLFIIAGGLFVAITFGLFDALGIDFPNVVERLLFAGGGGLIPVVALAVMYNPRRSPADQAFDQGLSKLIALLMRVLLPLTFLVLLVYLAFIPFNFREPFEDRNVLVIYNGMLFAVIILLVGATPVTRAGLSPRLDRWLRLGISAVAALAMIVSLYALAAISYRTAIDRLTPNRFAFIGWNVINIALLFLVLLYQVRARLGQWLQRVFAAFSVGTVAYLVWILATIFLIPLLFGIDQGEIEALPPQVRRLVYEDPDPILLKCRASPHIYLLESGKKRWVNTIATFEDRGFEWRDVQFISCEDLRSIPDGVPIPKNAGPPPVP